MWGRIECTQSDVNVGDATVCISCSVSYLLFSLCDGFTRWLVHQRMIPRSTLGTSAARRFVTQWA